MRSLAILLLAPLTAMAQSVGVHAVSWHAPSRDYYENVNPGLYVRSEGGWMLGAYRNSLDRLTVWAGRDFTWRYGLSAIVAAGTGYQKREEQQEPRGANGKCTDGNDPPCYVTRGHSRGAIAFMAAGSWVSQPVESLGGIQFRATVMPGFVTGSPTVGHLSVERGW